MENKLSKTNRKYAIAIGIGLALFPIHNLWLSESTAYNGQIWLHLPAIGTAIWILATLLFLRDNYKQITLGSKFVWIPLIVIVVSIAISGFINAELKDKLSPMLMGIILFASYIVARILGKQVFYMLVPFAMLGSIIAIVQGILNPGIPASVAHGMITNYCAYAGFIIFGVIVNKVKYQWLYCLVAVIGVFFIGSLEGMFVVAVLAITILIRRDYSKRLLIIAGSLIGLAGIWIALGYLTNLYEGNHNVAVLWNIITGNNISTNNQTMSDLTSGRFPVIIEAMKDIRIFGHGFSLSTVGGGIVHNIPLIIVDQIGILGAIAWMVVTIYCLIKTKFKYAFIMVLAMGVWDHYLWTQFLPLVWVLIGVATSSTIDNDYIFRRQNESLLTK